MSQDPEPADHANLKKLINASGYLLQLRLEHQVRALARQNGWQVAATEHPWRHPESGHEGFIDLVLDRYGVQYVVVECKRPRDAKWVFLVTDDQPQPVRRVRWLWAATIHNAKSAMDWSEFYLTLESQESAYCVVRGSGEGETGFLERICSRLADAAEALALERVGLEGGRQFLDEWIFTPMLVTTADLYVCRVKPEQVSLTDGELDQAEFDRVPWIRFRKTLSPLARPPKGERDLTAASRERERTILVVNAAEFGTALRQWNWDKDRFSNFPWEAVRRAAQSEAS